ncbi:flagellin FliC [Enterobacter hormaechei]|uniref:flagellin N-terminal helical domain-containing protein n=1 Tax=Enterobacter hormaechei TaxID=158836 RepID=UPI0012FACCED|nr:flagellin [Enterobacter hormaechei]QGU36011.1 flagellin FliC [Enterobacter hormaechei]
MAQVINTNSLSLITQNNINKNQSSMSTAIERLSSGLRINSAKDDAAGQAIANRFTSNIKGLTQAARNANDGISVAQTTEGALSEINNNLQRIRELSVQASTGTNSDSDLASIQDEITSRLDEIDRVSEQTQFNGVNVLAKDGSMKIQVGANDGQTIEIDLKKIDSSTLGLKGLNIQTANVSTGKELTTVPTDVTLDTTAFDAAVTTLDATATATIVKDDKGSYFAKVENGTDTTKNGYYSVSIDNASGAVTLGTKVADQTSVKSDDVAQTSVTVDKAINMSDASVTNIPGAKLYQVTNAAGDKAYALKGTDNKLYAADVTNGVVTAKTINYTDADGTAVTGANVTLGGTNGLTEVVTVGSGENAKTYKSSDLSGANLQTQTLSAIKTSTSNPLAALDDAISSVDKFRSSLGAIQNRLDSAVTNLNNTTTNLSEAQSRIQDADYATEVSNMSKAQIVQQAGNSVLAKANQVPQQVLSLLQG